MSTQAILKGLSWLTVWLAISLSATEAVAVPNANGSLRFTLVPMRHESTKAQDGSDVIKMKGFGRELSPGNPVLPRKVYNIAIPPNVIWSSIELKVISANTHALEGTYDLQPAGPYMASAGGRIKESWGASKKIINGKNADIYEVNANYPLNPVKLLPYGQMRKWKFVRVSFSPFQYNPVAKKLFLTEKIELELSYSLSDEKMAQSLISDTVMDDVAAQTLLNYDQAKAWYNPEGSVGDLALSQAATSGAYPYVIITTNAIESGSNKLADFIAHKRRQQNVLVVTEDDFDGLTGPPPNHRAERIRQWLINNYASMRIMYVLLIGDPTPFDEFGRNQIPMKMCWPRYGEDEDRESSTDYFYADLTGNWDKNGDYSYGQYGGDYDVSGGVDLAPEVYVGRIPVYYSNYTDLDNILQKIIDYETEPIGDLNWRQSILLPMSFQLSKVWGLFTVDGAELAEQMKDDYLDDAAYSSWRMYQQGNGKCGDDSDSDSEEELRGGTTVYNRWASNDFGIVCWWGHGNTTQAIVGYDDCVDGILMASSYTAGLDDDHPSFTYQCSCSNGCPEDCNNLQYAILKQGGIATVSASRVSWFHPFQSYGEFDDGEKTNAGIGYDYVKNLIADAWFSTAGIALYSAKSSGSWPDSREWLMNEYDFNLYGDPSTSPSSHARLTVYTAYASGVGGNTATLSGQLHDMGTTSTVQVSFLWGNTNTFPMANETPPQIMTAAGYFYASLTGLTPETTYYFYAKAVGDKTVYGTTGIFITSSVPPRVGTNWVTDIAANAVTLNGELASLGSASSVQVFFEWGDSTLYGNQTPPVTMTTAGPFSARISGLVAGTTYHFRAKAVGQGTGVGGERPFMAGAILRVPSDYHTIQIAIDVANPGQIIMVADGTYSGTGNRDLNLLGKRITLQSENGPANCIIDCQYSGRGFNVHGENLDTVVSGFTIKNGFAFNSPGGGPGGGIYCSSGSIINCNITNCSAVDGGGIYGDDSLFISDCTVNGNTASISGGGIHCNGALTITGSSISNNTTSGQGGGITCRDSSTITACTISGNEASGTDAIAGGVYCYESMTIRNCTISGNRVYLNSPGLSGMGGGIYCRYNTIIADSLISGNEATGITGGSGGGISCWDSTIIQNSIITGNKATGSYGNGGGIFAGGTPRGTPILTNCTITGNQAPGSASAGGGISCYGSPILTNCILWGDSPNEMQGGSPTVTYCDIQGGHAGIGNINAFPMLTNYHLECGSPCIDAGNNNALQISPQDYDGDPRISDGDSDGTAKVDIGADETRYRRPLLSDGSVSPASGDQHTIFRFVVNYFQPDVYPPTVKDVVIDGTAHTMYLLSGSPASGIYYCDTTLRPGTQYYFSFNDGHGCSVRLPATGNYTGPLVSNQCPTLANGDVDPNSGDAATVFRFTVDYYDADGMMPIGANIIIDGTWKTMAVLSGTQAHGTYYYDTILGPGTQFYFYFVDGGGCTARLPSTGRLPGPTVTGLTLYVPDDYPGIQAALDGCVSGDTIIVRAGRYTGAGNKNLDFKGKALTLRSEHGPFNCIIDCEGNDRGFYFHSNEHANSVVNGFTITNGNTTGYGGAIYCYQAYPTITNCWIIGNSSSHAGGGICYYGYSYGASVSNCVFAGNSALNGGGIAIGITNPTSLADVAISNCTLYGNAATTGGGIWEMSRGSITSSVANCILWGNTATNGSQLAKTIGGIIINNSDIQGGQSQVYGSVTWGSGNIDLDPRFANVPAANLRLLPGSPGIDTGYNIALPISLTTDLGGSPRCMDGDGDSVANVDMGAYELIPGDLDSGGSVNMLDFAMFTNQWPGTDCTSNNNWCLGADLNHSGLVAWEDLCLLTENWLIGVAPYDLGVYEFIVGDINRSNFVNLQDFAMCGAQWLETGCASDNFWCQGADLNHSGSVALDDLCLFVQNWLIGIAP